MANIPFDDRDGQIWFNGEMIEWRKAKVHVLTHGLHYASSVFEGERVYNGTVFKLTEHTERLHESARQMGFEIPYSVEEINAAHDVVLKANGIADGYVRPLAWRGSEMMGVSAQHNRINLAIAAWEWPSYFSPEARMAGIKLMIAPWRRPDPQCAPVHAKAAGLYMICTLSKHEAERQGYHDALMLDWRGQVAEATGANVFFVMPDGAIHTPIPDCFLNGITRQTVIGLARDAGYEVVERAIMPEDIAQAREVFLTGTAAEITPVGQIADAHFTPGDVTRTLIDAYDDLVGRGHKLTAAASVSAA
ncbi:branched-chain amino acid aminotransferase [Roseospira marina]|uniref:Branched-chain-amino-acid aminotransferase n=1 Tax=Roseospira marina TaxID=140057 RepID=A0A5M6IFQ9_9PROT|nr:branched-chain amino acid aminotransferase [Roseospira marina]KAA5606962.1 branched-chain amino acid aminotransferase [Roseospira marina]MBB4312860.1 branched-chain amino acid aminotransferase [Roseospira marina]MBB5086367.1 branched-chain amino acid aminotransferase [Roseospira marina]